jgi:hypothetical protein
MAHAAGGGVDAASADAIQRIAALRAELLLLSGKAHKSERNRINRELWSLEEGSEVQALLNAPQMTTRSGAARIYDSRERLLAHWTLLHCEHAGSQGLIGLCIRCGKGDGPSCRFHPDAKAFAFGTGRFDYGFTSAWDTPHDRWFCCGKIGASDIGCCEEALHTLDEQWWRPYAEHAPSLEAESSSGDDDEDTQDSGEGGGDESCEQIDDQLAAMDIC